MIITGPGPGIARPTGVAGAAGEWLATAAGVGGSGLDTPELVDVDAREHTVVTHPATVARFGGRTVEGQLLFAAAGILPGTGIEHADVDICAEAGVQPVLGTTGKPVDDPARGGAGGQEKQHCHGDSVLAKDVY